MAYSFPLSYAQFMALLPIRDITFELPPAFEISGETEGGELITAARGERLWQGEIQLGDMTADEAAECLAMIDVVQRPGGSFLCHDISRPRPRSDPDGAILGAASPTLSSVDPNNRDIRLAGLPSGFQLRRYDYLTFTYGSNPVRRALHRVAEPATAAGSGITGAFEVSPAIRPGFAIGTSVNLVRASCKAIIVPGSFNPGRRSATLTVGAGFRFAQTLR